MSNKFETVSELDHSNSSEFFEEEFQTYDGGEELQGIHCDQTGENSWWLLEQMHWKRT